MTAVVRETVSSDQTAEWFKRQWNRYDRLVENFTRQDDDAYRKALCLAFVKSVLNDHMSERLLAESLFVLTESVTSGCERAIGKDNVSNAKSQLLFLLWTLPCRQWQKEAFEMLKDYCNRNVRQPAISFSSFVDSTMRILARKLAVPLTDLLQKILQ